MFSNHSLEHLIVNRPQQNFLKGILLILDSAGSKDPTYILPKAGLLQVEYEHKTCYTESKNK